MSGFDSPAFKKNFPSTGQPLREFTVGPPEMDQQAEQQFQYGPPPGMAQLSPAEAEQSIKRAREEKAAAINKIGDQAKKRIEILANIGRLTKDVEVGGISFSLRTLKAVETRDAALATFTAAGTQLEASYEARKQQLARSIYKIDGQDIDFVLGTNTIEGRLELIEQLEETLVNKLYDDFVSLKNESKSKYGISTPEEAKEVGEDLKK